MSPHLPPPLPLDLSLPSPLPHSRGPDEIRSGGSAVGHGGRWEKHWGQYTVEQAELGRYAHGRSSADPKHRGFLLGGGGRVSFWGVLNWEGCILRVIVCIFFMVRVFGRLLKCIFENEVNFANLYKVIPCRGDVRAAALRRRLCIWGESTAVWHLGTVTSSRFPLCKVVGSET